MNRNTGMNAGQVIGTMNGLQVIGLDIAKQVFQMHTVEMNTGEIVNVQLKRAKVLERFANKPACLIAIEACGGAHHWARELSSLGHSVRLLHAKIVRPFVSGNKTDATDARAIWLAVQQPGVKCGGIKTTAQQATLTLHRQREVLMKMRIMQTNALRGLLYEFGATFAKGKNALLKEVEATLDGLADTLPQMVADSLREQVLRIKAIEVDMQAIEKRLQLQPPCVRLVVASDSSMANCPTASFHDPNTAFTSLSRVQRAGTAQSQASRHAFRYQRCRRAQHVRRHP